MKTRHKIYFVLLLIAYVAICFYAFSRADTPTLGCHVVQSPKAEQSIVTRRTEKPATWDKEFRTALNVRPAINSSLQLPAGHYRTANGWDFLYEGRKKPKQHIVKGITVDGTCNKLIADARDISLWTLRATKDLISTNHTISGNDLPGTVGIRLTTAEEYEANGVHQVKFTNLSVVKCETGVLLDGTYKGKGPDHRNITFENCQFIGNDVCVRAIGGNIATVTFIGCQFQKYDIAGIQIQNKAGTPDITLVNCGFKTDAERDTYAIDVYQSGVTAYKVRVEGVRNGLYRSIGGNKRNFHDEPGKEGTRIISSFSDVSTTSETVGINATAGVPLSLRNASIDGPCVVDVENRLEGFCMLEGN